jgi:hypothetical protein
MGLSMCRNVIYPSDATSASRCPRPPRARLNHLPTYRMDRSIGGSRTGIRAVDVCWVGGTFPCYHGRKCHVRIDYRMPILTRPCERFSHEVARCTAEGVRSGLVLALRSGDAASSRRRPPAAAACDRQTVPHRMATRGPAARARRGFAGWSCHTRLRAAVSSASHLSQRIRTAMAVHDRGYLCSAGDVVSRGRLCRRGRRQAGREVGDAGAGQLG